MIDCNEAYGYIHERNRMCGCYDGCNGCPFSPKENGFEVSCANFELYYTGYAIYTLQKWSNANPREEDDDG